MLSRGVLARRLALSVVPLLLIGGCASSVNGSPVIGTAGVATQTGTTGAPDNQVTVPSNGAGGGRTTASGAATGQSGQTATGSPSTTGSPSAVPSGLEKFYSQQLSWGSCTDYASDASDQQYFSNPNLECARLTLPLSYSDPSGQTISTGVLRIKATGTDRIGSLLFNPGGPGEPGLGLVAQIATLVGASNAGATAQSVSQLAEHFDLVGFDPRGTGTSQPAITCRTDAERDQQRTQNQRSATAAEVAASNKILQTEATQCAERTGAAQKIDGKTFLANTGTVDAARDMDVLRAALGDNQLNYVGYSYGTLLGTEYARQFPHNIRAMVLDGAVDPSQSASDSLLSQTTAFQKAFETFSAWCVRQQNCALGTDAAKATQAFQQLARPLLDKPITITDGRQLSFTDAITGVSDAMYSDSSWPDLASALTDLANGKGDALMALADSYDGRDSDGHYTGLQDAFDGIRCMDSTALTDDAAVTKLNAEVNAAAPFAATGDPAGAIKDVCAFWPVPPTRKVEKLDLTDLSSAPLVVSTTGDPATPYQSGVSLASQLHASLLTIQGTRHTGYLLSGITCADQIGNNYLINLTPAGNAATCS